MSLLDKMKRAFGFDPEDQELLEAETAENKEEVQMSVVHADKPASAITDSGKLSSDIFDAVVRLFNEIQPEFVSKCINTEEQRQYILDSIDAGVRNSLETAHREARLKAEAESEAERKSIASQLEKLKGQYASLEDQRKAFQNDQLSATRQKRALTERVHDLETQVETLTAEKEQFELESRSMQNKLRVMSVTSGGCDGTNEELEKKILDQSEEIESLKTKNKELEQSVSDTDQLKSQLSAIEEKLKTVRTERDNLQSSLNEMKMNLDFSEKGEKRAKKLLEETRANAETAENKLREIKQKLGEANMLKKDLEEAKKLNAQLLNKNYELENSIKQQEERIKAAEELQSLLDATKSEMTEQLNAAKEETESLKTAYEKSLAEKDAELEAVRASISEAITTEKPKRGRKPKAAKHSQEEVKTEQKSKPIPKISAIDELIDESEWLVAPSADDVPATHPASEPDDDFGYKAPPKKAKIADDVNQLRLF